MTLITLDIEIEPCEEIAYWQDRYSRLFRFAYARITDQLERNRISSLMKDRFPDNTWMIRSAIIDAEGQYEAHMAQQNTKQRTRPVIWGTRQLFNKLTYEVPRLKQQIEESRDEVFITNTQNKIDKYKQDWKTNRLRYFLSIGEVNQKSNRFFNFSLDQNVIIFKPNAKTKIPLILKPLGKNREKMLRKLQLRVGQTPISIKLSTTSIHLTYEVEKEIRNTPIISTRYLGIDMNPSHIGCTILDVQNGKTHVVASWEYEIKKSARSDVDKRQHETIQIAHAIMRKARHYLVGTIGIEELQIKSGRVCNIAQVNRTCISEWNRQLFTEQLKKKADILGIKLIEVLPQYSSTIGNLCNRNLPDACASAAEIARRAHYVFKKGTCLFPKFQLDFLESLNHQNGREIRFEEFTNWVQVHKFIKKTRIKYRVPLDGPKQVVLDFQTRKSQILVHNICINSDTKVT